jgi:hypothetical protein
MTPAELWAAVRSNDLATVATALAPNGNGCPTEAGTPERGVTVRGEHSRCLEDTRRLYAVQPFVRPMGVPWDEADATLLRIREAEGAEDADPDVVRCPRCLEVMTDESRCAVCGRHGGEE